ncbi:MAG: hypothetical protein ACJ72W_25695 [Actinoallomurus sp.]
MALSKHEEQLRAETRTALLNAIKASAEAHSEAIGSQGANVAASSLQQLAEAFALVTGRTEPHGNATGF